MSKEDCRGPKKFAWSIFKKLQFSWNFSSVLICALTHEFSKWKTIWIKGLKMQTCLPFADFEYVRKNLKKTQLKWQPNSDSHSTMKVWIRLPMSVINVKNQSARGLICLKEHVVFWFLLFTILLLNCHYDTLFPPKVLKFLQKAIPGEIAYFSTLENIFRL